MERVARTIGLVSLAVLAGMALIVSAAGASAAVVYLLSLAGL